MEPNETGVGKSAVSDIITFFKSLKVKDSKGELEVRSQLLADTQPLGERLRAVKRIVEKMIKERQPRLAEYAEVPHWKCRSYVPEAADGFANSLLCLQRMCSPSTFDHAYQDAVTFLARLSLSDQNYAVRLREATDKVKSIEGWPGAIDQNLNATEMYAEKIRNRLLPNPKQVVFEGPLLVTGADPHARPKINIVHDES